MLSQSPSPRRVIEPGRYSPEQLGLPFPKVYAIFVGYCGGGDAFSLFEGGHTHKKITDNFFNSICIQFGSNIYNSDGSISELMWHEYAHVEDRFYIDPTTDVEFYNFKESEDIQKIAHNWHFVQACERIGHPEVAKRKVQIW